MLNITSAYVDEAAGEPGATSITNHEPSTWLRGQVAAMNDGIEAGTAHHCRHLVAADQDSLDMARFAALWKPGVVACLACVAAGAFRMSEDEAGRCDRCGQHAGALAPFLSRSGDFIVHFKLCVDCGTREGAPAPDTTENGDHA